ncbi:glycosyltransferase [Reichenbachiella ulvae]|uniref:Glycosyltransferase n=1 Tax=Reichenbachiella ulvae TaxID=2980104 RepID=A0ABT3CYS1_9BACT|nr:glycosyltransferase [Reichenbachiella ulvae]MCV9388802.1 glycosyltransferase [Reichenbachiella ulvae]
MNILFFGYWGANEGLSQATINPHLKILADFEKVNQILYVSIERKKEKEYQVPNHPKIKHLPFQSLNSVRFLSKFGDFIQLPFYLKKLIRKERIDLLMCRSSLAGGIGYWAHRLTGVPFTVESFEPHADYMAEHGIWSKTGISYRLQKHLEEKQKQEAFRLMPVTEKYKEKLINEGVNKKKVTVMPCTVDIEKFAFSDESRKKIRQELNIPSSAQVGIYVGKFGDIYWDKEAFQLFKSAFEYYQVFHLILLNPALKDFVISRSLEFGIPISNIHHWLVKHAEVPDYLSAADFAFSLHKPSKQSFAFSPIKNGEYWANGLPIISPDGIGDDSDIIRNENGGLIIENDLLINWSQLIKRNELPKNTLELAKKYRNLQTVSDIYTFILNEGLNY